MQANTRTAGILILTIALATPVAPPSGTPANAPVATPRPSGSALAKEPRFFTDGPPNIEIDGGTAEQRATVTWAVRRFQDVGLDFAPPAVYLHQGTARCDGGGGVSRIGPNGASVHICADGRDDLARRVLHELAHVWDLGAGRIPVETRAAFLSLRGLKTWNDAGEDWPRRGAEQAAEIIAWGLQDGVGPIPTRVTQWGPNDLESLTEAFHLLVGVSPLWMDDVAGLRSVRSNGSWDDI